MTPLTHIGRNFIRQRLSDAASRRAPRRSHQNRPQNRRVQAQVINNQSQTRQSLIFTITSSNLRVRAVCVAIIIATTITLACAFRGDVHRDGDYHRAVHVWIFAESTRELLLQRRASCKDSWPDLWDISSAGHISAGDSSLTSARYCCIVKLLFRFVCVCVCVCVCVFVCFQIVSCFEHLDKNGQNRIWLLLFL